MIGPDEDDEPETWPCYRHPGRETALCCSNCERPICTDCAAAAAVGIKCPECSRQSPAALAKVPQAKLARGLGAGAALAAAAGVLYVSINTGFFGLVLAYLLGMAVGEVVKRASGGYRDPALARGAAVAAAAGLLWPVAAALLTGGSLTPGVAFIIVAAAVAAWAAYSRTS